MKQDNQDIVIERSGEMKSSAFGIRNSADMVHIFGVLRSKLYSDKILAFVREYSTNAFDEHVAAGIREKPIQVSLPTRLDPYFKVRDFGRGLSEAGVREVYCMYGASTKRESNAYNGQMGFGSKSAFAYSDFWQISSHYDGVCSHYSVYIDESGLGEVTLMSESPTETTGVEVSIPIETNDFNTVIDTARRFYRWFEVRPIFKNTVIPSEDRKELLNLPISQAIFFTDPHSYGQCVTAIMGNVAYPVELNKFIDYDNRWSSARRTTGNFLKTEDQVFLSELSQSIAIKFDIGELQISASRESLEYKEKTLSAIKAKLSSLRTEAASQIIEESKTEPNIRNRVRSQLKKMIALRLVSANSTSYRSSQVDIEDGTCQPYAVDLGNIKCPHECVRVGLNYSTRTARDRAQAHPIAPGSPKILDAATGYVILDDLDDTKEAIKRAKILCEKEKSSSNVYWVFSKADLQAITAELTTLNLHKDYIVNASYLPEVGEVEEDEVKVKTVNRAARKMAQEKRKASFLVPSGTLDTSAKSLNWKAYEYDAKVPTYYIELENLQFKNCKMGDFAPHELIVATENLIKSGFLPKDSIVVGVRDKDLDDAKALNILELKSFVKDKIAEKGKLTTDIFVFRELNADYQAYLKTFLKAGKKFSIAKTSDTDPVMKELSDLFKSRLNNVIRAPLPTLSEEVQELKSKVTSEIKVTLSKYPLFAILDTWKVKYNDLSEPLTDYIKAIDFVEAQEKVKV